MAQTTLILQALKTCLKQKGITYAQVATQLDLSEASVKRIFSEENISLQRLDQICAMMNMEITDLSKIAKQQQQEITELTEEQEAEFHLGEAVRLYDELKMTYWNNEVQLVLRNLQTAKSLP